MHKVEGGGGKVGKEWRGSPCQKSATSEPIAQSHHHFCRSQVCSDLGGHPTRSRSGCYNSCSRCKRLQDSIP